MKFTAVPLVVLLATLAVAQSIDSQLNLHEPPMLGIHWARGVVLHANANSSPNLLWHNGGILTSASSAAIFWGTSWTNPGDKISGMDKWYTGVGGTPYIASNKEYTGTNGRVGTSVAYGGHHVDTSAAPSHAPKTSDVLAEVCKVIPNPVSNGYYAVYVDTPRGGAQYCAWHSYGSCGGKPVQFAFFFKLDGDAGCDPQSNVSGESQGLKALANVSGHELSETLTDPRNGGWWDSSGAENADKCAWSFGGPSVTFSNGSKWKIQGNWSNYDYNHSTGYKNRAGQAGCADGSNVPGPYTK